MNSIHILTFVIPVNALIFYGIYKDIKEYWEEYTRLESAKKNLLNESIEIYLDSNEVEMLDDLSKGNRKKYLRDMIKEVVKNGTVNDGMEWDGIRS